MERRRRLARLALTPVIVTVLAVTALGGVAGCGATAGSGQTVPPSTSPK